MKRLLFSPISEISVIVKEESRRQSWTIGQLCNGVTEFKQVENKASNPVFGNAFSIDVMIHVWNGNSFTIRWTYYSLCA